MSVSSRVGVIVMSKREEGKRADSARVKEMVKVHKRLVSSW